MMFLKSGWSKQFCRRHIDLHFVEQVDWSINKKNSNYRGDEWIKYYYYLKNFDSKYNWKEIRVEEIDGKFDPKTGLMWPSQNRTTK